MPHNPHTLISRADVDANLVETTCCQMCFKLYPDSRKAPMFCTHQSFKLTPACKEALFIQKTTHTGIKSFGLFPPGKNSNIMPINYHIPQCLLVSQPISTWLTWLLSKPDTEDAIETWEQEIKSSGDILVDVQNGSNYQELNWDNSLDSLNLTLSLFVDWFNPRGNKISGKVESTGLFAFTCLNLPPSLRNKISYICLYSITPGPLSPDTSTINNLLAPIVDELIDF